MSSYQALYKEGLEAQQDESYDKALDCYYKIAAEDEVFPALYNNMAMCMKAMGQDKQALTIMAKAARLLPDQPEIILNYARLLSQENNWGEVEHVLTPLIEAGEENPEALFLMAKLHFENKNYPYAYEFVEKAYHKNPEAVHALILMTTCLYELDREREASDFVDLLVEKDIEDESTKVMIVGLLNAVHRYEDLIDYYHKCAFDQGFNAEAEFFYGQACKSLDKYDKAKEIFQKLLEHDPQNIDAYRGLGVVAMAEEAYEEAGDYFKKALEIKPDCSEIINNYGLVLLNLDKLDEAEKLHLKAIEYDPTRPEPWVNLGTLYNYMRHYQRSVGANMKAIEVRPSYVPGISNLIGTLREMGEIESALEWLDILFEKSPGNLAGQTNKAFLNLTIGNIKTGWEAYECRKSIPGQFPVLKNDLPEGIKFWKGEDLKGKRIFIWSEQGIGDEIMFASCFQEIVDQAEFTVIECERRLIKLFSRSFPKAVVIPRQITVDEKEKKKGRCLKQIMEHLPLDYAIAAGSLPRYLRPSLTSFPKRESYFAPDPAYLEAWGKRMKEYDGKLKVGLCWRSGNMHRQRSKYYLNLELLRPLFVIPNVQIFNLQYGDVSEELNEAKEKWGLELTCFDGLNLKDDFDHVAALMMNLDCIVTAATAMGELGGALGRRVIRFEGAPDWTRLGADERPWYPHMTSLRRIGEVSYEPLVTKAAEMLREL